MTRDKDKRRKKDSRKHSERSDRDSGKYYKHRDRSSSAPPPPAGPRQRRLSLQLESVEIARGYDGPLRGAPEPTFVFAAFGVGPAGVTLLSRGTKQVAARKPYPSTTELSSKKESSIVDTQVVPDWERALILGFAVERDNGKDVEAIYASLADPERLSGWSIRDLMPEPLTLDEAGRGSLSTPPSASPVHLIRDEAQVSELCQADEWVGSAVVVLDLAVAQKATWRFHFASEDEKNDWTALVRLWIS